nr:unnamed protein product [Spirometra erinaceieuropaei]
MSPEVSCSGELEKAIAPKGTIQAAHVTESLYHVSAQLPITQRIEIKIMAYNAPSGDDNFAGYSYPGQNRIQAQQAQVNEVVDIMKANVSRVLERDQKLSDLDSRADQLQVHSRQFEAISRSVQRKYFWRNMKMWAIIAFVVIIIIIVIIIAATAGSSK